MSLVYLDGTFPRTEDKKTGRQVRGGGTFQPFSVRNQIGRVRARKSRGRAGAPLGGDARLRGKAFVQMMSDQV